MGKVTYPDGTTPTICIVGAGISGMNAGIRLKQELKLTSFTIYDENDEVGGTWLNNTYPGVACDVQSHLYSFSFEPNPNWSYTYPPGNEIWDYLKNVSQKHDLYRHIQFKTQIKSLTWIESKGQWKVKTLNKVTNEEKDVLFDIVINGPGALRVPNIPEEFTSFKGPILHSGAWDSSVDLKNKIIGVIGSGSSSIQMIPKLADLSTELHCYQRKPAWVMPQRQFKIPDFVKWIFANVPFVLLIFRWLIFLAGEINYPAFLHKNFMSKALKWLALYFLKKNIPDDDKLREKLTPKYQIGCKRIIVSNDYYPAMQKSHVKLHRDPIVSVKEDGIVTSDNGYQKLDALVLGTGFRVHDYFAPMQIVGKDSQDILPLWKNEGPGGYFGIVNSKLPNQFGILGPNTGLGHNTIIFMIECQVNFTIEVIREMMNRNARVVEISEDAEEKFQVSLHKQMEKTVWGNSKCGSWYANSKGVITTLWPWNCINYWWKTRKVDFEKFEFY